MSLMHILGHWLSVIVSFALGFFLGLVIGTVFSYVTIPIYFLYLETFYDYKGWQLDPMGVGLLTLLISSIMTALTFAVMMSKIYRNSIVKQRPE